MFNLDEQAALGLTQVHLCDYHGRLVEQSITRDLAQLQTAASKQNINIALASSFRDFERQTFIWNNKFNQKRPVFDINDQPVDLTHLNEQDKCQAIMLFSAIPGASRHHFGTDLDVFDENKVDDDYQLALSQQEYSSGGPFFELAKWLEQHAETYGFFLPYRQFNGGVAKEPWHISHISRSQYYSKIHCKELLEKLLIKSNVAGWPSLVDQLDTIYPQYVSNISAAGN